MAGGTLYLAGKDAATGQLLHDTSSCSMCRRLIINAGLSKVIARTGPGTYTVGKRQRVHQELGQRLYAEHVPRQPLGLEDFCLPGQGAAGLLRLARVLQVAVRDGGNGGDPLLHAGKGFAVVADEVKQLAAKSAEAAQSATDMVNWAMVCRLPRIRVKSPL